MLTEREPVDEVAPPVSILFSRNNKNNKTEVVDLPWTEHNTESQIDDCLVFKPERRLLTSALTVGSQIYNSPRGAPGFVDQLLRLWACVYF